MIYVPPTPDERIDQGDLIDACPISSVTTFSAEQLDSAKVLADLQDVIVLTHACDLANE